VKINAVLVSEIELYDTQRIVIALPLLELIGKMFNIHFVPVYGYRVYNAILVVDHHEVLLPEKIHVFPDLGNHFLKNDAVRNCPLRHRDEI